MLHKSQLQKELAAKRAELKSTIDAAQKLAAERDGVIQQANAQVTDMNGQLTAFEMKAQQITGAIAALEKMGKRVR